MDFNNRQLSSGVTEPTEGSAQGQLNSRVSSGITDLSSGVSSGVISAQGVSSEVGQLKRERERKKTSFKQRESLLSSALLKYHCLLVKLRVFRFGTEERFASFILKYDCLLFCYCSQ